MPSSPRSSARRSGRAAPMAPDERRQAIIDAVVPLLLEHGDDLSTRQIAEAAGIAEGTIFRAFPDKPALLLAAAAEIMSPIDGRSQLTAALAGATTLREKVVVTARRLEERAERVMRVMMALRRQWMSEAADHSRHDRPQGPPAFLAEANAALQEMLTEVFEPHRSELTVEPGQAALLLRTLSLGSRHPGSQQADRLTPDDIADVLLDGIRAHHCDRHPVDDMAAMAAMADKIADDIAVALLDGTGTHHDRLD